MRSGKNDALESVSSIMEKFISNIDYSKVQANQSIHDTWEQIVPKEFKNRTKTLNKTADGTLFVACENSMVTNELFMQKTDILSKIPKDFEINNIVFTHKAWKKDF